MEKIEELLLAAMKETGDQFHAQTAAALGREGVGPEFHLGTLEPRLTLGYALIRENGEALAFTDMAAQIGKSASEVALHADCSIVNDFDLFGGVASTGTRLEIHPSLCLRTRALDRSSVQSASQRSGDPGIHAWRAYEFGMVVGEYALPGGTPGAPPFVDVASFAWRVYALLVHARATAAQLGGSPKHLLAGASWKGLKGRDLRVGQTSIGAAPEMDRFEDLLKLRIDDLSSDWLFEHLDGLCRYLLRIFLDPAGSGVSSGWKGFSGRPHAQGLFKQLDPGVVCDWL